MEVPAGIPISPPFSVEKVDHLDKSGTVDAQAFLPGEHRKTVENPSALFPSASSGLDRVDRFSGGPRQEYIKHVILTAAPKLCQILNSKQGWI